MVTCPRPNSQEQAGLDLGSRAQILSTAPGVVRVTSPIPGVLGPGVLRLGVCGRPALWGPLKEPTGGIFCQGLLPALQSYRSLIWGSQHPPACF